MSRLRKTVVPFRWGTINANFTNGTSATVNLASFLTNPQNRAITYSALNALPSGVSLSAAGVLSYNGSGAVATASVQFRATSSSFRAESSITPVVVAAAQNQDRPVVWAANTPASFTVTAGTAQTFDLLQYASDPDGDPIVFTRTGSANDGAPGSVVIDSATGVLTVPADAPAGSYTLEIDATGYPLPPVSSGLFEPAITGEPQIPEAEIYRTVDDTTDESVGGVSWSHYYRRLGLRWENPNIGDYTGTTAGVDVAQGGDPFSTGAVAAGVAYKTFDVTALVGRAVQTGINKGFYLRLSGSNGPSVTWSGRLGANPPLLSVTNTLGQTFQCPCILSTAVYPSSSSTLPVNGANGFQTSTVRFGVVQFDVSTVTGTVQLATMSLYAEALFGSNRVLNLYELRPPRFQLGIAAATESVASLDGVTGVPPNTIATGLAAEVGDSNLVAADGTPLHPDVYCAGDFTGTTFPNSTTAVAPRIRWGTISRTNTVEIVPDPDAPGTAYWRGTANNVVPGSAGRTLFKRFYDFTPAVLNDPLYPIDVSRKVEECYVRAYFMWEPDFLDMTEGMKCGLGIQLQYGYWVPTSSTTGYWQPYGASGRLPRCQCGIRS